MTNGNRRNKISEIDPLEVFKQMRFQNPPLYHKTFTSAHRVTFPPGYANENTSYVAKKIQLSKIPKELRNVRDEMLSHLRIIQRLIHPSIIRLLTIILTGDQLFIIMPFYQLCSIEDHIQKDGKPLPDNQVITWFSQTLGPIKYLHDKGIVHRNLKLSTLLIKSEIRPSVIVSGFGLNCQQYRQDYDIMRSTSVGDSAYRAPEMHPISSRIWPYDARATDMYALGICLYRMLTAAFPFDVELLETNSIAYVFRQRQANLVYPVKVNDKFKNLIQRLLEPKPGLRFTILYALMNQSLDLE